MKGIVFFCGYHGVGKTYTANALLKNFDAEIVDCGPIIRQVFQESGCDSFGGWSRCMELRLGSRWDDKILLDEIKKRITGKEILFVVGNRDIETILFIASHIYHQLPAVILYLEKPTEIIKKGYESRTGHTLTKQEFERILHEGPDRKLMSIREYAIANPNSCKIIYENGYGDITTMTAKNFIHALYN